MRRRRHVLQVSTFPFLAVLLCTMGSLILLLLVIDRRAKAVARFKAAQAVAESLQANAPPEKVEEDEWAEARRRLHASLEEELQEVRGQAARIHDQTGTTTTKLAGEQTQSRDLQARLDREKDRYSRTLQALTARKEELAKTGKEDEATERLRRQLTADLSSLEQTLADLKELRKREQRTFSLVPYKGRRGDTRRPVYLECTTVGWIFHPDLKALSAVGDGMKTLRAEFEARLSAAAAPKESSPYVFLLVRPDGIASYYRALTAMQGMQVDFGYEFVDASWILDFSEKPETAQPWMTAGPVPSGPAPSPAVPKSLKSSVGGGLRGSEGQASVTLGPAAPQGPVGSSALGGGTSQGGNSGTTSARQGTGSSGNADQGSDIPNISATGQGGITTLPGSRTAPGGVSGSGQLGSGPSLGGVRSGAEPSFPAHASKGVNFSSPHGPGGNGGDAFSPLSNGGFGAAGASPIASTENGGDSASPPSPGRTGTAPRPPFGAGTSGVGPSLPSATAGNGTSPPGDPTGIGDLSASRAAPNGGNPSSPPAPGGQGEAAASALTSTGSGGAPSSPVAPSGTGAGAAGTAGGGTGNGTPVGGSGSPTGSAVESEKPTSPLGPPVVPYPGAVPSGATGKAPATDSGAGASSGGSSNGTVAKGSPAGDSGTDEHNSEPTGDKELASGLDAPPLSRIPKTAGGKTNNAKPRPTRLTGNRDWIIPLECTADAVVLPTGVKVSVQAL
ncbi:MAG TPA: hypothetical protein VGG61_13110, partial [Gemmataceae bacterium]